MSCVHHRFFFCIYSLEQVPFAHISNDQSDREKKVQRQRIERKTHTGQKLVHRKIDFVVAFGGGGAIIVVV